MGYCLISIPVLLRKRRHVSVQAQGPLADGHLRPKDSIASRTEGTLTPSRPSPPVVLTYFFEITSRTVVSSSPLLMPADG